jgi:hypothetical protein
MRQMMKYFIQLCSIGLLALLLIACGPQISEENYNKINKDMSYENVVKLLGQPTEYASAGVGNFSGATGTWQHGDMVISIQFINGKVGLKSMSNSVKHENKTQQ